MATVITIILAFVSTNIDDFFLLIILFSQVGYKMKKLDIIIGQYFGSAFLILFSALASYGLNFFSGKVIGWLGIIPILLGVKTYKSYKKEKKEFNEIIIEEDRLDDSGRKMSSIKQTMTVAVLTVSNGADNIGVYIPLFSHYDVKGWGLIVIIFSLMILLWCYLGFKMINIPYIQAKLDKTRHIIVPVVFIALGIFILVKNGILF